MEAAAADDRYREAVAAPPGARRGAGSGRPRAREGPGRAAARRARAGAR
ncbi:hypothetical protein ACFQYP_60630 [Nonomuraea antimicrobica]